MMALSIRQPWAELILQGRKRVELRTWTTGYRGRFWIHTGRKADPDLVAAHGLSDLFTGGYVGAATLAAIVELDRDRWEQWSDEHLGGPYQPAQFGWVLTDVVRFGMPLPAPGKLRLFEPPADVAAELDRRLARSWTCT